VADLGIILDSVAYTLVQEPERAHSVAARAAAIRLEKVAEFSA
jgi:hypothetical protein